MSKLQEIKNEVAQEWGHTDWNDFGESFKHRLGSAHAERDDVMTEIARRYAQAVAEDALKRAAERVPLGVLSDNRKHEARQSILSTEINLDLAIEKGAEG